MTEEMIVNGVDVSGCKYAEDSIPVDCNIDTCFCYENNDCYYKQLKRLEAENTKLKNKYNENITVNTQLQEWQDEDLRQIAELKNDLDLFRKAHDNEQAQRRIFEQKLEKIEEALTTCLTFHTCQKCKFYKECEMSLEEFILEVIRGAER